MSFILNSLTFFNVGETSVLPFYEKNNDSLDQVLKFNTKKYLSMPKYFFNSFFFLFIKLYNCFGIFYILRLHIRFRYITV